MQQIKVGLLPRPPGGIKPGGILRQGTTDGFDSINPFVAFSAQSYSTFLDIYPVLVQSDENFEWISKLSGSYRFPYDIQASALLEARSGEPWARTVLFAGGTTMDTVRQVLEAVFVQSPRLRGYVLDDQGRLRQHVVVYIDGERIEDPVGLGDAVGSNAEVYVMQALSGG